MPNGYRRGGSYTRNGQTFYRRGTSIKAPSMKVLGVGVAVGAAALFGTGSAMTIAAAGVGIAALVSYRYRRSLKRMLRPVSRRLTRKRTVRDPHRTGLAVTVTTWGKVEEEALHPAHPQAVLEDPDTWWKTGGDPCTENQQYVLRVLGHEPKDVTKAEASRLIASYWADRERMDREWP